MTISFTKVKLPYGWLSNMSHHAVVHQGVTWPTAEALFQALRFDDPAIREQIRGHHNPMHAKIAAKKQAEKMMVEQRSPQDLDNMRLVLRLKIEQYPHLLAELLATGQELIVEDCTNRRGGSGLFWGAARSGDDTWEGENWLGRLWMEVRDNRRATTIESHV